MIFASSDTIAISLTEETLKVIHLKGKGADQKIINVSKKDIKGQSPEEVGKVLKDTLSEMEIKAANVVSVIPSSLTTTKNIEIPSTNPDEIKSIIDLQAGRHTPYSREDILIGYIKIGEYSRNYTKVLLIIVNRQVIKGQISVFEQAGVKLEKILFAPEAKAKFYAQVLNVKAEQPPIGIIDAGKYFTDFTIEANNTVVACRNIPIGMEHFIKEGQDAKNKFITELQQSIESYQNEDNKLPDTYILTTDDAKIKELQPLLQEKLKATVKVVSYLDQVKAIQPVMLKIVSEYDDESFLDVMAPFNVSAPMQVDLTPDEVKVQRSIEEKGLQVVQAAAFSLVILLLVFAIFFAKIYFRSNVLSKISDEYKQKRKAVEELETVATATGIVKDYLNHRMTSLEVLEELYKKIPEEIYLKSIVLEENGTINIDGISETRSTAYAFITTIEDSELFKNAKMIASSSKKERGKDVATFQMSFKLESAKDEEEKPAEVAKPEGEVKEGEKPPEGEAKKEEAK
ncbi:MAG: hypothetical protein A2Z88_07220 [Omnitrophica WOR_2 bacterium GWA2_47_8]|nr:MAG: hypothetical protein A2Z88_07220 [Omnitrophica WOR_2 bacterium GWA2_47_8]